MEAQGLATQENKVSALGEVTITQDQVALIKNTIAIGATDDELKLFFFECRRRGVHPMDRLIHFVKRKSKDGDAKATFQCSIDFMRMQAEDTKLYRGQDEPEYGKADANGYPESARVVVHKKDPDTGEIYAVPARAFWTEFYPGETNQGFMWRKMPRLMLSKVAEAQALRKAFPRQFDNLYTFEEMAQTDLVASGTPKAEPKQPQSKSAAEVHTVNFIPQEVTQKIIKKKGGGDLTKYFIKGPDAEYTTFSESFAKAAHEAKENDALIGITYKTSQWGNDIETLGEPVYEGEDA